LREKLIPGLMKELGDGSGGWPVDGKSLTSVMHRNGVNVRLLGTVVDLCGDDPKLQAVKAIPLWNLSNNRILHFTRWCRGALSTLFHHIFAGYRC